MRISRRALVAGGMLAAAGTRASSGTTATVNPQEYAMTVLGHIRQIDYTVIFARDMPAMRHFYQNVMEFPILSELGDDWIEFRVGSNTLALTVYGMLFHDQPPPVGALALQMAFRVAPEAVQACAQALTTKGIRLAVAVTDQPWGHRTLFFRDPDGNILEIFAEI